MTDVDDQALLDWAARYKRVLVTHDIRTVTWAAYHRLEQNQPLAGVLLVRDRLPVAQAIEDLLLIHECSSGPEWEGVVEYLPR